MRFLRKKRILCLLLAMTIMLAVPVSSAVPASAASADENQDSWDGAQWIWDSNAIAADRWMCFRKTISVTNLPKTAAAKIAACTKYYLWVNGKRVVLDGELRSGPRPNSMYYDQIDLSPYLKAGQNTIAILAWHWGVNLNSYRDCGQGGLLFDADIDGTPVISDGSWLVRRSAANKMDFAVPSYHSPNEYYDARDEMDGWNSSDESFDAGGWAAASTYGSAGDPPYGGLEARPIPMLKDYGLKDYKNIKKTVDSHVPCFEYVDCAAPYTVETDCAINNSHTTITLGNRYNYEASQYDGYGVTLDGGKGTVSLGSIKDGNSQELQTAKIKETIDCKKSCHIKITVQEDSVSVSINGQSILKQENVRIPAGSIGIAAADNDASYYYTFTVKTPDGTDLITDGFQTPYPNFSGGKVKIRKGASPTYKAGDGNFVLAGREMPQDNRTQYSCTMPYNCQLTPYLKISAKSAGEKIRVYTDSYVHLQAMTQANNPTSLSRSSTTASLTYVTKKGEQEFEARNWISGAAVIYDIPDDVAVEGLEYRESGYDTEFAGSFQSNDPFFNTLWRKAARTTYICMRDTYMDCPDREQTQWWGDATNEIAQTFYAFSPSAYALAKKGVNQSVSFSQNDALDTIAPNFQELPIQMLDGIHGYLTYYLYTGDKDTVTKIYPAVKKYLSLWEIGEDGLLVHRYQGINGSSFWDWSDWNGACYDVAASENAWYCYALQAAMKMAEITGATEDVASYESRFQTIRKNFNRLFWDGKQYRSHLKWDKKKHTYLSCPDQPADERDDAIAVLSGIADKAKYPVLADEMKRNRNASPWMERYVEEALYVMGDADGALSRMKKVYRTMTEDPYTTLWESFAKNNGSLNHGWGGGCLTVLSQYAAGVAPTQAAYSEYQVVPRMGTLQTVDAVVPSGKGNIVVRVNRESNRLELAVSSPRGTVAKVGVPIRQNTVKILANGTQVWNRGKAENQGNGLTYDSTDGNYVYFQAQPGTWEFCAEDKTDHEDHGGSPVVPITPTNPDTPSGYVSDTTSDLGVSGAYTFRITSKNGKAPRFAVGTKGVFDVRLVKRVGGDYYYRITAVGAPGAQAGIYINGGGRLLIATVKTDPTYVRSDTTAPFEVKAGNSYVFKLTADAKPYFVAGTQTAFQVAFVRQSGRDYFFRITAVGKAGQASGFYINSHNDPVAVAAVTS